MRRNPYHALNSELLPEMRIKSEFRIEQKRKEWEYLQQGNLLQKKNNKTELYLISPNSSYKCRMKNITIIKQMMVMKKMIR